MIDLGNKKVYLCAISISSELELFRIPNTNLFGNKAIKDCFGEFLIPDGFLIERVLIHQTNNEMQHILTDIEYKIKNNIAFFKIAAGTEFIGDASFPVDVVLINKS